MIKVLLVIFAILTPALAIIHPIEIKGNHFYDSITNKPVSTQIIIHIPINKY